MPEKIIIGNAELWHGDCREVLPLLPKHDLLLTDPPYGIGESSKRNASRGRPSKMCKKTTVKDYGYFDWDRKPIEDWILEIARSLCGKQIIFGGNYYDLPPCKGPLIWDKLNSGDFADGEMAWNNLGCALRIKRHLWNGFIREGHEERFHPTQKPLAVIAWCLSFVPDAATVLDPFMGSGTTGVACAQLGKAFTGIERECRYFDIACERIARAQSQGQLFAPETAPTPVQERMALEVCH